MTAMLSGSRPRLVVIDGIYAEPGEVRTAALATPLESHPERHKKRRGPEGPIAGEFRELFGKLLGGVVGEGYSCYQVCVAGDQIVYHSDLQSHAAVVFLQPDAPPSAGTSFYRSRETGLRAAPTEADAERLAMTPDDLEWRTYGDKLLDPTAWEEVDRIGNVYNRLAIWDAKLLHAASNYFGTRADNARLFQMFFFSLLGR